MTRENINLYPTHNKIFMPLKVRVELAVYKKNAYPSDDLLCTYQDETGNHHASWVSLKPQSKSKYQRNSGGYFVGGCSIPISTDLLDLVYIKGRQMDMFFVNKQFARFIDQKTRVSSTKH